MSNNIAEQADEAATRAATQNPDAFAAAAPSSAPAGIGKAPKKMIELIDVDKYFGSLHVLKHVNMTINAGEVVVVIGPSGSGKSTLCRTINRLEIIQSGSIVVDDKEIPAEGRALAKFRAEVGMVFQQFNLFANKTVLQNVTLGPVKVRRLKKSEAEKLALQLLDRVGLKDQAHKYPAQLSGGQQQRVAIARALAMKPKALLFDEPTSALDPEMVQEVLDVILALAKEGLTMVIVTHEMAFARDVADRIIFMNDGEILEDAPPEEFFQAPKTERARNFLSMISWHNPSAAA